MCVIFFGGGVRKRWVKKLRECNLIIIMRSRQFRTCADLSHHHHIVVTSSHRRRHHHQGGSALETVRMMSVREMTPIGLECSSTTKSLCTHAVAAVSTTSASRECGEHARAPYCVRREPKKCPTDIESSTKLALVTPSHFDHQKVSMLCVCSVCSVCSVGSVCVCVVCDIVYVCMRVC